MPIRLRSLQVLKSNDRVSSVDIFRSFAILVVVLYHFNQTLPYGYLGVDLFFVISGLLVGGLLTKEFREGNKIRFSRFFLQRGFKIWPSYYIFLLAGSLVAIIFYSKSDPEQVIPWNDLKRYVFFYQNYTGAPYHPMFDHVWSLCVEEHFYILLPLLFLFVQRFIRIANRPRAVVILVIATILAGTVSRYLSYFYTHSKVTYAGTHNRIDALAWGVLLNLVIAYKGEKIKAMKWLPVTFVLGAVIFALSLYVLNNTENQVYSQIWFQSITPLSFFLMILGVYWVDFSRLIFLRVIAYYSYNWYLWHPIFVIVVAREFGSDWTGLLVYLAGTFLVAVIATICVEEKFLLKRKAVIDRLFKKQ